MSKPKLWIQVRTFQSVDPTAPTLDSWKLIDHNDSSDRKWLANHLHWAMRNNRKVIIAPESN